MDCKLLGAVAAALVLVFAGCGSSKPLSRADYVKQANAICARRRAMIAATQKRHGHDFKGAIKEALPGYTKSVDQLAGLKGPADVRAKMAQIVTIERAQISRVKAALDGRRASNTEDGRATQRGTALKQQLGLTACS
jgi:hypothetical protein